MHRVQTIQQSQDDVLNQIAVLLNQLTDKQSVSFSQVVLMLGQLPREICIFVSPPVRFIDAFDRTLDRALYQSGGRSILQCYRGAYAE
jgi:hypothetical protein